MEASFQGGASEARRVRFVSFETTDILFANFFEVSMEVRIDVGESEPIDSAISRFRREVSKSGHIFELKRRQEFEPNSVKRQRKRKQAVRKAKLALFRGKRMENFRKDIL